MASQVLKDKNGNRIGEIKDNGNVQTIHDKNGNRLGEYKLSTNTTHDRNGNKIGTGNLLVTLLNSIALANINI